MDMLLLIIIFSITYWIINAFRIIHNVRNKDYLLSMYPEGIREKWQKVYEKPIMFLLRTSLLRIPGRYCQRLF
ncbi:MAG: hypothetical protein JXB88_14375 [Spirochaetales bacterium]|nr:hypothetical protein [Spirochaetales bacterium]